MSQFSRRSFLQMLGFGAGGVVLAPPSLFGTENDASTIWMPEQGVLTSSNLVVYHKPITTYLGETTPVERRALHSARGYSVSPLWGGPQNNQIRTWKINRQEPVIHEYQVRCGTGDPHVEFIKASAEIQRQLAQDALDVLTELPQHLRQGAQVVTIIHSPIHARPKLDADTGFDVFCEATVRTTGAAYHGEVTDRANFFNLDGYTEYSKTGEYPVEVPTDLDFGILMKEAHIVLRYEPMVLAKGTRIVMC